MVEIDLRGPSDADLVAAFRGGDTSAFATLYDRFADRIHTFAFTRLRNDADAADVLQDTFVRAATRIDQLRDPERFRPWLFAIARNSIVDVKRDRARTDPVDDLNEFITVAGAQESALETAEAAKLLWDGARGLQERDQELLELHLREGLEGAELAEAMGVEQGHLYVMTKRLKERLEKSIGSLLVARGGRSDCDDLAQLLVDWDGRYSRPVRATVTRHVESCDVCKRRRRALVAWEALAPSMPMVAAPAATKVAVLAAIGISPALMTRQRVRVKKVAHRQGRRRIKSSTAVVLGSASTILAAMAVIAAPQLFFGGESSTPTEVAGITESAELPEVSLPVPSTTLAGAIPTSSSNAAAVDTTTVPAPESTLVPSAPDPSVLTGGAPATSAPAVVTPTTVPVATAPVTTIPTTPVPSITSPATTSTVPIAPGTTSPTSSIPLVGARIRVAPTPIQFGSTGVSSSVVVDNTGDATMSFSATVVVANSNAAGLLFTLSPSSGQVSPGSSITILVTPQRSAGAEGDHSAQLQITSSGGNTFVPIFISIEHPPVLVSSFVSPATVFDNVGTCAGDLARTSTVVSVTPSDESGLSSVAVVWGASSTVALTRSPTSPGEWTGRVGPWPALPAASAQSVSMTIVLTDTRGNVSRFDFGVQLVACV